MLIKKWLYKIWFEVCLVITLRYRETTLHTSNPFFGHEGHYTIVGNANYGCCGPRLKKHTKLQCC